MVDPEGACIPGALPVFRHESGKGDERRGRASRSTAVPLTTSYDLHTMKPRLITTLAALGLALGTVQPGAAQIQLAFYPRVGLLAPDEYFYEQFQKFVDEEPTEWTTASLGRTGIFGIGAEMTFGDGDIRLRGEIMNAFDGWLIGSH